MRKPRMFAVLPTLLTLGNGACGFGSITFAAKVGLERRTGWGQSDSDCLWISGMLVFLAMVFDMLDGRAARWTKQSSQFGAELDSLCDAISFGVAPAFILVKFSPEFHPRLLWVIAVMYVACAILRLARFNVETDEEDSHEYFSGLPSPAAAGTVASFMIAYPELVELAQPITGSASWWDRVTHDAATVLEPTVKIGLPIVTLTVACLMVSRFRYSHVFNQWFGRRQSFQHLVQLMVGIAIAFMVQELAMPLIFCWFALGAPLNAVCSRVFRRTPRVVEAPPTHDQGAA